LRDEAPVTTAVVILAAGSGTRAGGGLPKQYQTIAGKPLLRLTLEIFCRHPGVHLVQPVISKGDEGLFKEISGGLNVNTPAIGGATRQQSGHLGLEALAAHGPQKVLIHDAARPFVSPILISDVVAALDQHEAAIPAMPIMETLKRAPSGVIAGTVERQDLWAAQTPQGFRFEAIRRAHRQAAKSGHGHFTDDAAVAEWAGMKVIVLPGERSNVKLTTADDMRRAEELIMRDRYQQCPDIRVGHGFDVHAFKLGDHVVLCGVRIAHTAGLEGHSDADAPVHALTDALFGSIGEADIGTHFPPSDAQWKGAGSSIFLSHAVALIEKRGGFITHADLTIVCEAPRVAPHIAAMRSNLCKILKVSADRIGIKATTSEGLGFTGRGEGLAAFATATVRLP
jgi:2-C-methyl-D-erythritol 4-phosphate cytidylyltransferase / 2-C-methyl-D-erythritol 2,4-cyclodiphosphate synthase